LISAFLLSACGDGETASLDVAGPEPTAGILTVQLETPHPDDGAVMLALQGNGIERVEPVNEDHHLFVLDSDGSAATPVLRIALVGDELSGALIKFAVPDVQRVTEYYVELIQVADHDSRLRGDLSGYAASVMH
jgi:hypothetical protein